MSRTTVCATALVMACIWSPPCLASQPDTASMKRMYKKMKAAMGKKEEAAFKAQWHPRAYATNLVGGSGLPGKSVYRQGTRKGWYLKLQMAKLRGLPMRRGGPWIVPTLIWSDKKGKAPVARAQLQAPCTSTGTRRSTSTSTYQYKSQY